MGRDWGRVEHEGEKEGGGEWKAAHQDSSGLSPMMMDGQLISSLGRKTCQQKTALVIASVEKIQAASSLPYVLDG